MHLVFSGQIPGGSQQQIAMLFDAFNGYGHLIAIGEHVLARRHITNVHTVPKIIDDAGIAASAVSW